MKRIFALIIMILMYATFAQSNKGENAYTISENDLIPEGITYSKTTNCFYVSSIFKTKIVKIDSVSGEYSDFIASDVLGLAVLGMVVDDKRNHLWACANGEIEDQHISAVVQIDLLTGKIINLFENRDTVKNTFNDLALDAEGNIYFTDSDHQTIYRIDSSSNSYKVFFDNPGIAHPNGIAVSPDGRLLYVASNVRGIRIIDLAEKKIVNNSDPILNSKGIDGLKLYKNSVIGIMNSVWDKADRNICRYFLDESGTNISGYEIIERAHTLFDVPTTFVIVGDQLYCLANSQLLNIKDGKIVDPEKLNDVIILKYNL